MGNAASQQTPGQFHDVALYQAVIKDGSLEWNLFSDTVVPKFYDINEDIQDSPAEWHMEFEGSVEYPDVTVDSTTQFVPNERKCVFQTGGEGDVTFWALGFPDQDMFAQFSQIFHGYLFENTYQTQLNEDNIQKELGHLGGGASYAEETDESRQHWVEDMDIDVPEPPPSGTPGSHTKDHVVAEKASDLRAIVMGGGDRSYLVGEGGIGVMKNTLHGLEDANLDISFDRLSLGRTPVSTRRRSSIGAKSTPSTNLSSCSKGMLMDHESKMNLFTPGSGSIYSTDLESEKILNEFSFKRNDVDVNVIDITSDSKSSQLDGTTTFLSLADNSIDRWDTRVKEGLVQTMASPVTLDFEGGRSYASKPHFSCMATSGQGYRAVGSKDGKIRLYNDKVEQIAKTSIPGLGAPIDFIDVTYDGRWVLATTKSFLIVIKTIYKEGSKELCGFTSRLGQKAPKPRLLMLKPEDKVLTKNAPFEKAKFTWITDQNRKERYIVASCGNFTVQWNFRSVKIAKPDVITNGFTTITRCTLIPKSEHILDTTFMHDAYSSHGDPSLVVLTKQKVYNVEEDDDSDREEEEERDGPRRLNF
ncbi:Protein CYPRO4 [Picochlorum sp. SENEW3]|nr:Protein CYPRO4 [Picochlorum sp. SENEW3]WPT14856.1 Protein CYPRO4 [Picochlorum sp. SENEW3]